MKLVQAQRGLLVPLVAAAALLPASPSRAQPAAAPLRLSIEDALRRAERASDLVEAARAGVARAQAEQVRARSEYFPQISGTASYDRTIETEFEGIFDPADAANQPGGQAPALDFGDLPFGRRNIYRFGVSLFQNLFAGGRVRAGTRLAGAGLDLARVGVASARAQAILDVARAYFDVVESEQLVAIAEATLAQAERTLAQTRLAQEVGAEPRFEVLRAEVAVGNQRPLLLRRRLDREVATVRLRQLLQIPMEQPLALTTDLEGELPHVPALARSAAGIPDQPGGPRAPVQEEAAAVSAREAALAIARSQRWPALALGAQYGRVAYPDDLTPTWDQFRTNFSVGLALSVPLFTGGRITGDIRAAEADRRDAVARLRRTEKQAVLDTRVIDALVTTARQSWEAAGLTVRQAERAYEIAELRHKEGLSSQLELSDARLQLENARTVRAQAARELQVARIQQALLPNLSIRNPVVTTVLMLALVVFGSISLLLLETDEFPDVNPPIVAVQVPYPGAAPANVEREVIEPLEEAIAAISGVGEIRSTAMDSFAILKVTFLFDKDLQQASQDIRDKISEIRDDLPPEIEEPILTRFDPNDLPIVSLTLTGKGMTPAALTRLADPGIVGELRGVPDVAEVELVGGVERELTVELRPAALEAVGLGVAEVVQALEAQNLAAPVGRVTGPTDERTIRLQGRLERPEDFEDIVLRRQGDRVVRLREVAQVRDGTEEPRSVALFDGQPAVGIDIIKSTAASTTAVSERIRARAEEVQKTLPPGVTLRVVRDAGVRVERSVEEVQRSLLEGAALTVLVVFAFLASWRSTVITGLALPVSVLASFIAVWALGFTLNTMSLLGLSLAIGILIDDAIVVRENIVRHMEMGKAHLRAAREGTSEIGLAVAATTFSIVAVFVPVAFMGGITEQWFAPFALTIACSVLVSLFVSFSLDPMLSAYWADPEVEGGKHSWLTRRLARWNAWLDRQTARYRRVVGWALRHRLIMVAVALVTFAAALAMPAVGLVGIAFFPEQDRSEFTIDLEPPPGSNLAYTRQKAMAAAALARARPEVLYTYTTVGGQGEAVDEASVYVRLSLKAEREDSANSIAEALRDQIARKSGVAASLATGGFGDQKQIQVQITGTDSEVLARLGDRAAAIVRQVPGAVDVSLSTKGQRPELSVEIDRDLAGSLGITVAQVAQALRPAFAGLDAGDWVDPAGETRDVVVRLLPEARREPGDLARLPLLVAGPEGPTVTVPLGQVARIRRNTGPAVIEHLDQERVIVVGANTENRPLNQVVADIDRRLRALPLPPGYAVRQGGETEDQREVFGRIFLSLGAALLLMYLILVIQFRSFLDPIPIMASLPLSLIGVMLAMVVTGSTLNIMSMIGVILLMGIVAKNAILLIDFAKWAEMRGLDRQAALVEAGGVRLRPILMTSTAIIAGMVPIALGTGEGADFRAPLGRTVIGGVITSTLLTLLVIPTFYDILAGGRARLRAALTRRRRRAPAPEAAE